MIPVILAGGSGTRLWPLSRGLYPKQFLALAGEHTMFQETLRRLDGMADAQTPIVLCNAEHRFLVAEQLQELGIDRASILLEPVPRSTAPAAALAALDILARAEDETLLVLPADHLIQDPQPLQQALMVGAAQARDGGLVTFGIEPDRAHTGYGYIQRGPARAGDDRACSVARFVEKPDAETASRYVASGEYLWNSGMFMFQASRYLQELERLAPEILEACREAYVGAARDMDFTRIGYEAFARCPEDSIDYAVMERTEDAVVVPLSAGWSDVGAWSALYEVSARNGAENVEIGDVLTEDTTGSYLRAESRLLATLGVHDHVVVETPDAVLVAHRDRVDEVKAIVARLKAMDRCEAAFHKRVYRPWGWYEGVAQSQRFQVKRIQVKPGASLSLQMHHHRAEHWIVVSGTARVHADERSFLLSEDQSTYIPLGTRHRLENPGVIPLELMEVQTGSYLGEDDIVRFEDHYGRT